MRIKCLIFLLSLLMALTLSKAQITFKKVYPTSLIQSARDVLPTSDGGYFIAGTKTTSTGDSDVYMLKTNAYGDTLWTKRYGGVKSEYPYSMVNTTDGNFFVVGYTKSYGAGGYDTWLLKLDPSGNLLWSKTFGTAANDNGHEIITTSDGNYMIVGTSAGDATLTKIDPSGTVIWMKTYGGGQLDAGQSVKQCNDGGYILSGETFSYGAGNGDIYVVRTDALGAVTWSLALGGAFEDEGAHVLANTNGTFMVDSKVNSSTAESGFDLRLYKLNADGATIWTKTYGGADKDISHFMNSTSDGGYIIASTCRSFGWINPDMWLIKTNSNGDTLWTRHYGSWYHDHAYAVRQVADGGFICIGHSENSTAITQIMFVKTDGMGAVPVAEVLGTKYAYSIYPNPSNGILNIEGLSEMESPVVDVRNSLGETLYSDKLTQSSIDLRKSPPGVYFITVTAENTRFTKKIILQ